MNSLLYKDESYYFDLIKHECDKNSFYTMIKEKLPKDWTIETSEIYMQCRPNDFWLPNEGWKIHISSTLENSKMLITRLLTILFENKVVFKVMLSPTVHQLSLQKNYPRESAGKLITIYPSTTHQFKVLIEEIYKKFQNQKGQYILSDKRYRDSEIIYYRYGAFKSQYKINKFGKKEHMIRLPDGSLVRDNRNVIFNLPKGIENPFQDFTLNTESKLLKKYKIVRAIRISNSGGVYEGIDLRTSDKVIIKEARNNMMLCLEDEKISAQNYQAREYKALTVLRKFNICPTPIEIFKDWENQYLVEKFLEGVTLYEYAMLNNPLYKADCDEDKIISYIYNVISIFIKVVEILVIIENAKYIYTDISDDNIIIKDKQVYFIDFESFYEFDESTKCILQKNSGMKNINSVNYSLTLLLFSLIIKHEKLLKFDFKLLTKNLEYICYRFNINWNYDELFNSLMTSNYEEILIQLKNSKVKRNFKRKKMISLISPSVLKLRLKDQIQNTKYERKLFFPEFDYDFNYNYGWLGVFNNKFKSVNELVELYKKNDELLSVGLVSGWCGCLYYLIDNKYFNEAEQLIIKLYKDERFLDNFSFGYGLMGFCFCIIKYLFQKYNELVDSIRIEIITYVINEVKLKKEKNVDYQVYGLFEGASGISLVFFYDYLYSKDKNSLNTSLELINYELSKLETINNCNDGALYLPFSKKDKRKSTYFAKGTGGLIAVLVRMNYFLNYDVSNGKLVNILKTLDIPLFVNVGQFYGASGVGDTLLDCYKFLNEKSYLDKANQIAESLNTYLIFKKNKIHVPSDGLDKCSYDYATGLKGVLNFLERLDNIALGRRFFLDEIIEVSKYEKNISEIQI
ncbi:MAG: RIO1 family regulatory kinase/ATPase [Bacilli bacterium]